MFSETGRKIATWFLSWLFVPPVTTLVAIAVLEDWCRGLFGWSIVGLANQGSSIATIFMVVFLLFHAWFAIRWWFFRDFAN